MVVVEEEGIGGWRTWYLKRQVACAGLSDGHLYEDYDVMLLDSKTSSGNSEAFSCSVSTAGARTGATRKWHAENDLQPSDRY
jgi:hypothetical protein